MRLGRLLAVTVVLALAARAFAFAAEAPAPVPKKPWTPAAAKAEPATAKPARTARKEARTEDGRAQRPARLAAVRPQAPVPAGPVLRVAVEGAYPPFSETDGKGRLKGFDIDIARALCAELAMRCEFVQRPWAVIQDAVIGVDPRLWNEADAIVASVSITDSRRQTVDFTKKYYHIPARFLCRAGGGVEAEPGRLGGRRIGVQAATTFDRFATARFGEEARILRFETLPQAVAALKEGKVELVLADAMALQRAALEGADGAAFELCGPNFVDPVWFGQGAGIVVRKGNQELLAKLDAALERIRAKGEHARIAKAYFRFDIDPR
ncbi:MAG: transporter substrate-binding domain-containing protein [Geminicoccaceae bacterium]|nr:transporter substrate-binding domain-containing protein [Geminicoccaceae bacterium]MCS7266455.1 transporter substrate-binding domain-containing protein [Geminicoccaceae bacterium]MCX7630927.1 transporter substrate-binding domain-containing protein [Geminicoccaceae bacterium]MDW8123949.1 transporter substrate-binding domain-containing protein [Geminicoccaceae bacterium]MDW8339989.1 transporter substrate-binding domain-containing protein [Geminicoccaceae bacterium]